MQIRAEPGTYARAMMLAHRHRRHAFDTLYHAVALKTEEAVLVAADKRCERQARGEGRIVRLREFALAA